MSRSIITLFILLLFNTGMGQNLTVSVPVVTANVGQDVIIPVKLNGAGSTGIPISSANIQITFDTAVLTYDTLQNFYSGTPQNQWFFACNNGLMSANWLEPSLLTVAIPNNTTLYEIKFQKKPGSTPLTFVVYEFTDALYNLIPTTPVNGAVNAQTRQVTFRVDMARETISTNGVFLAGSFNSWSTTQTPMTWMGNSLYSITMSLPEGQDATYRFVNGNNVSGMETVPAVCGVPNTGGTYDRSVSVQAADTILPVVCFSMCSVCPANVNVTYRVDMQHMTISPEGVHVAGTFNNWSYAQSLMTQTSPFIYEYTQILEEGSYQEFLFVNGYTATGLENPPATCTANGHRYFTVPGHDTVLTAYCFDSCVACGTVPQFRNVTFRVNLANADSIAVSGVFMAGSFQGWIPGITAMTLESDSVYTHTESFLVGTQVEYKFLNGSGASGYEVVPAACAVNGNRAITVPDHDTLLIAVCFSECDTCTPITGWPEPSVPSLNELYQNVPNPASSSVEIGFRVGCPDFVSIRLYDITGKEVGVVHDGFCAAGRHSATFPTALLRSGIYFYRMTVGRDAQSTLTRKMIIIPNRN